MKFVYEAADSSEGSSRHTSAIYVCIRKQGPLWMSWNQIYSCKKKKKKKYPHFQIIKKMATSCVSFFFFSSFPSSFFFTQKIAEIWHVRNVQGGRLTEGVEVG